MNLKVATSRLMQHLGRARLIIDLLRQTDQAAGEKMQHTLGAVMDELDMAASILRTMED
jgi:hypothetical protein